MASTALLLPATNVYLTHFFGDWAKEMFVPDHRAKSRPAQKFWIPKSVCARINFAIHVSSRSTALAVAVLSRLSRRGAGHLFGECYFSVSRNPRENPPTAASMSRTQFPRWIAGTNS